MAKIFLLIAFIYRGKSVVIMYILTLVTSLTIIYRVYVLLMKSHMFNITILRAYLFADFAILHFLCLLLLTVLKEREDAYIYYVAGFLPITLLCGFFLKNDCNRTHLAHLMDDKHIENSNSLVEKSLCYLHLIRLYMDSNEEVESKNLRML